MFVVFLFINLVSGNCDYRCQTCDQTNNCLNCHPTRNLISQQCVCSNSMIETSRILSNQCFECNQNCKTCLYSQRNYCQSCHSENHRVISNGKCICDASYIELKQSQICVPNTQIVDLAEILVKSLQQEGSIKKLSNVLPFNNTVLTLFENITNNYCIPKVTFTFSDNIKNQLVIENHNTYFSSNQGKDYIQIKRDNVLGIGTIITDVFTISFDFGQQFIKNSVPYEYTTTYGNSKYQVEINQYKNQKILIISMGIKRTFVNVQNQQYLTMSFLFIYQNDDYVANNVLEMLVDNAIQLIGFCNDPFCQSCSFYNNVEKCKECQANTEWDSVNNKCVCKGELHIDGQCYFKCKNPNCISCTKGVCLLCQPDNTTCNSITEICDTGYYEQDSKCYNCPQSCSTCTSGSQCQTCIDNYYEDNSICKPCVSPCKTCQNQTVCSTCLDGFFFTNNVCQSCSSIQNCFKCNDGTQCLTCNSGFYVQMQLNLFSINSSSGCSQCQSKCRSCISNTQCEECVEGYYQSFGNCNLCYGNCQVCPNSSQCHVCDIGYFVQSLNCKPCDSRCSTCSESGTECYSCIVGLQIQQFLIILELLFVFTIQYNQ